MLIQSYGRSASKPMSSWSSDEIRAHIKFQQRLNVELTERGELVDAQGLSGPDQAKFVVSNGSGAPGRHRRAVRRENEAFDVMRRFRVSDGDMLCQRPRAPCRKRIAQRDTI